MIFGFQLVLAIKNTQISLSEFKKTCNFLASFSQDFESGLIFYNELDFVIRSINNEILKTLVPRFIFLP